MKHFYANLMAVMAIISSAQPAQAMMQAFARSAVVRTCSVNAATQQQSYYQNWWNRWKVPVVGLTATGIVAGATALYMTFSPTQKYRKYNVPPEIKGLLDSKKEEIADTFEKNYLKESAHTFPWLPNLVIKNTVPGRLEGREYCKNIIEQNATNMSLLEVPLKYYYPVKGHEGYIVAEKVEGTIPNPCSQSQQSSRIHAIKSWLGLIKKPAQLSLEQTIQLCDFIMASGWEDSRRDNYALRKNGNISIVDTQLQDFNHKSPTDGGIIGLRILLRQDQHEFLCNECKEYVHNRLQKEISNTNQQKIPII